MIRGYRFELRRALSLRSTWVLGVICVAVSAAGSAVCIVFIRLAAPPPHGYVGADVPLVVLAATPLATTGAAVLGAALGGADGRHRLADMSRLLTPRTDALLGAKVILGVTVSAALGLVTTGVAIIIAAIGGVVPTAWTVPVALAQIARVTAWGLLGLLVAVAARSQVGGLVFTLAGGFVVEPMLRGFVAIAPQGWWSELPRYLPFAVMDGIIPYGQGSGAVFTGTSSPPWAISLVLITLYLGVAACMARLGLGANGRSRGAALVA